MSSLPDPSSAPARDGPGKIEPDDNHDQLPANNSATIKVEDAPAKKKKSRKPKGGKNRATGFEGKFEMQVPSGLCHTALMMYHG